MANGMVLLGIITAPHGIKGEVKIHTFTESPENITAYGPLTDKSGTKTFKISVVRTSGDHLVARINGISDRNEAEKLRKQELYVFRSQLPETASDEYYIEDLVELKVVDASGLIIGSIVYVHNFGGGEIVEVKKIDGQTEFHPLANFEIDLNEERAILNPADIIPAEKEK